MNFLIAAILTYPASLFIELKNVRDIVQDAAKEGYKINLDYFRRNSEDENKTSKLIKYIPFINVIVSLSKNLNYLFNRTQEFEMMRVYGAFDRMTKEEEEYYKDNPNFIRALNIASKSEKEFFNKEYEMIIPKHVKKSDNLQEDLLNLNEEIDEHDIIMIEKDKTWIRKVTIDEVIDTLDKDELEELKNNLVMFRDWDKLFNEKVEGEYTVSASKNKILKFRFKSKT